MKCHAIHAFGLGWDQRRFMIQERFYFEDYGPEHGLDSPNQNFHTIKPTKVEYTSGGNFTKAASLPEKMCCGNAIVIGKGSEQTIYLSGGLR